MALWVAVASAARRGRGSLRAHRGAAAGEIYE